MRVLVRVLMLTGFSCSAAAAAPLSATFDPTLGFPEEQGFQRFSFLAEETVRSIENDVYRIDSSASVGSEFSFLPGLSLAPGETLCVSWRMRTVTATPGTTVFPSDVKVGIGNINIWISPDAIYAGALGVDPEWRSQLDPTFNEFTFVGDSAGPFELSVNGQSIYSGTFATGGTFSSQVSFGDGIVGMWSVSDWSGIEVHVVPEPVPWFVGGATLFIRRRR